MFKWHGHEHGIIFFSYWKVIQVKFEILCSGYLCLLETYDQKKFFFWDSLVLKSDKDFWYQKIFLYILLKKISFKKMALIFFRTIFISVADRNLIFPQTGGKYFQTLQHWKKISKFLIPVFLEIFFFGEEEILDFRQLTLSFRHFRRFYGQSVTLSSSFFGDLEEWSLIWRNKKNWNMDFSTKRGLRISNPGALWCEERGKSQIR